MEWSAVKTEDHEEQPSNFSPFKRQFLTVLASLTAAVNTGFAFGYSAILIPQLQTPESDIQINLEITSWIACVIPLFMVLGCFASGPLMERFGRKGAHFVHVIPTISGLIIVYFSSNWETLILGRIIWGFGTGIYAVIFPIYYAEIASPKYRGFFISLGSVAMAIGIFFVHLLGTFLTWRVTALISIFVPISTLILMTFVHESPSWFVTKNRYEDALKTFKWFRGYQARGEFEIMWEQHQNFTKENRRKSKFSFEILGKPEFYKPFLILACLFFVLQFTGSYIVTFFSIQIFKEALGSKIDEYLLMNCFDIGRIIISIFGFLILRVSKRRFLLTISGIGVGIFTCILASLFYFPDYFKSFGISPRIVVILFAGYFIAVSTGISLLPFCSAGEMMPLKYRSFGTSSIIAINYFFFFISIKLTPDVMDTFGIGGMFVVFGSVALVGTFILYFVMPETKNLTLEQIEEYFSK